MRGTGAQPLVGRATELQLLEDRLDAAAEDRAPIIAVTGEAGIGKSRLVGELATRARRRSITVLSGSCLHLSGGAAPLAVISSAVSSAVRPLPQRERDDLLDELGRELTSILPASLLGPRPPASALVEAPLRQQRLFNALLELFDRLARGGRLLLLLEDLHWADDATRDFLRYTTRNERGRVTSVVTIRTDPVTGDSDVGQLVRELEPSGDLVRIDLGPLPPDEIGRLVSNMVGRRLTTAETRLLHDRADGNPYYAQELALAGLTGHQGVPPSLQDVLLARFATQSPEIQGLLRSLAVLGREATDQLLLMVNATDEAHTEPMLRSAIRSRLVEPSANPDGGYRFRHALTREAVYADLLPSERRRLHRRAATAVESMAGRVGRPQETAALLAYHWEASGDPDRALVARSRASALALSAGAINDAYRQLRSALNLWDRAGAAAQAETGAPGRLQLRFALLAHANGRHEEALGSLAEATALGVPHDLDEKLQLLDYRCNVLWALDRNDESLAAAEEALRIAPRSRPDLRAPAHRMMAGLHLIQRRPAQAFACASEGLEYAIAAGDRAAERYLRWVIASCQLDRGEVGLALEQGALSYSFDDDIDPVEVFAGPANYGCLLASCGRYREVITFSAETAEAVRRAGLDGSHGTIMGNITLLSLLRLGRLAEADELLESMDASMDLIPSLAAERRAFGAELRVRQGRFHDASALVARCNEERNPWSQEWTTVCLSTTEIDLAAWQGQSGEALDTFAETWVGLASRISTLRLRLLAAGLRGLAELLRSRRGRDATLRARADQLHAQGDDLRCEFSGRVTEWDALLSQADAEYRRITGQGAVEAWTETVRFWDRLDMPYEASYARCRLGEQLLGARRRADAAAVLREAQARAEGIGAHGVVQLAGEIMARARLEALPARTGFEIGDTRRSSLGDGRSGLMDLSTREREVLGLIADGLTNRQIAEQLFISEKTAATHVSNILGKLQASSRAQAAAMLVSAAQRT